MVEQASTQPLPDGDEAEGTEKQVEAAEAERVKQRQQAEEAERANKQAEAAEAERLTHRQEAKEAERRKQQQEAEDAERAKKQAEDAEAERVKQRQEFEEAMDRWRLPPELDEQVAVLVAQHADLGLGDFADLSSGGGFKIQDTAKRATSLSQLMTLAAHIIRRVEVNREKWIMKKYVNGDATDHCVTSAYEVCAAAKRGAG